MVAPPLRIPPSLASSSLHTPWWRLVELFPCLFEVPPCVYTDMSHPDDAMLCSYYDASYALFLLYYCYYYFYYRLLEQQTHGLE